jgi:hypothetical protein
MDGRRAVADDDAVLERPHKTAPETHLLKLVQSLQIIGLERDTE